MLHKIIKRKYWLHQFSIKMEPQNFVSWCLISTMAKLVRIQLFMLLWELRSEKRTHFQIISKEFGCCCNAKNGCSLNNQWILKCLVNNIGYYGNKNKISRITYGNWGSISSGIPKEYSININYILNYFLFVFY